MEEYAASCSSESCTGTAVFSFFLGCRFMGLSGMEAALKTSPGVHR